MGDLIKDIFGGSDDSAQKAQIGSNREARADILRLGDRARGDVFGLADLATGNRNQGIQASLDMFGQSIPAQLSSFLGGNTGAQDAILAGVPQVQNAILGLPTDMSGLQTQQLPVDMSMFQQQPPEFQNASQLLGGQAPRGIVPPLRRQFGGGGDYYTPGNKNQPQIPPQMIPGR